MLTATIKYTNGSGLEHERSGPVANEQAIVAHGELVGIHWGSSTDDPIDVLYVSARKVVSLTVTEVADTETDAA